MRKFLWILTLSIVTLWAKDAVDTNSSVKVIKVNEMETKELYKLIEDDVDDLYLLDIREPDQVGHGEIFHLNLVTITRGYLEFKIENALPDKKARIVVYCCTGKRGNLAAKTLREMGYTNVYSLKGGIRKWVDDGYPLDTVYGEVFLKK
ncbi:MAG: rhodanese-like domain-containing protein [Campylobacterota bacterium]|nr:rhodanese-like domain-containing protein [Campylobacterota bacterium]